MDAFDNDLNLMLVRRALVASGGSVVGYIVLLRAQFN